MSNPQFAAEQLLELLLQLKKTTPAAARGILNSQPQIAYALITLMVNMNAINVDVFQKVLSDYGTQNRPPAVGPSTGTPPAVTPYPASAAPTHPISALPSHIQQQQQQQQYRTSTPPVTITQPYPHPTNSWPQQQQQPYPTSQPQGYPSIPAPDTYTQNHETGYGYGAPAPAAQVASQPNSENLAATIAAMPDDQKALIMRVITMTPEQIHALPPAERQAYIQIRATLGVPT